MESQLPDDWEAVVGVDVVVTADGPATARVPDVVVVRTDGPEKRVTAEVVLAVEIRRRVRGEPDGERGARRGRPFAMRMGVDALIDARGHRPEV